MATDIFDPELVKHREHCFACAFGKSHGGGSSSKTVKSSLSNTVVLENLMQASDIAHTMQHWHVYCKWNERLFREMYKLYQQGRIAKDPSVTWFEGEIKFLESIVIPLAKRLDDCQVFGVSSTENMDNAQKNLLQWKQTGHMVVESFHRNLQSNPLESFEK
jgi:hypothetical protein